MFVAEIRAKARARERALPDIPQQQTDGFAAEVGRLVRLGRAKRGMTRRQLAEGAGASERYLAQIEGGQGNPSVVMLKSIAEALDRDFDQVAVRSRDKTETQRTREEIGLAALRGGDSVGEHTVMFLGEGERLELVHRATDRGIFARGALRAARWVAAKPPGLYDMADVLGLA